MLTIEEKRAKQAATMRRWRINNPDKAKQHDHRRWADRKDKYNAYRRHKIANDPEYRAKLKERYNKRRESEVFRADAVIRSRAWRKANPEKYKALALKINYGITIEDRNRMLIAQDCRCAICGIPEAELTKSLHVDHCHSTKTVRGLLCHHCNAAIGLLKDSPELAIKAAEYLKRTYTAP